MLKEHGSPLSARAANLALVDMGILDELERTGSKGATKRLKSLTDAGLRYGRNETSPQNPRETQPLYYVRTFPELLDLIKDDGISVTLRAPHPTVQRNFRLRRETAAKLKAEATRRSQEEGRRVTENELVEMWLQKALK